jgi:uncharacterized protein YycO
MSGAGGLAIGVAEWLDEVAQGHWRRADRDSLYRHVFVVESVDSDGTVHAIEAWPGGARRSTYRLAGSSILWSSGRIELTEIQRAVVVRWAVDHLGAPYSWLDFVLQAGLNLHVPGARGWLERRVIRSGHYLCSGFVAGAYNVAGVRLWTPPRAAYDVAPSDLANLLG